MSLIPTFRHGRNTVFKIADAGGTIRDISNVLREVGFPRTVDTAETSAFGTFDKTYVVGMRGATIRCSGMFDATTDGYLAGILGLEVAGAFTGAFQYGPEGATVGYTRYTGVALMTSYEKSGAIGDMVSANAEWIITGAVTRDTWP